MKTLNTLILVLIVLTSIFATTTIAGEPSQTNWIKTRIVDQHLVDAGFIFNDTASSCTLIGTSFKSGVWADLGYYHSLDSGNPYEGDMEFGYDGFLEKGRWSWNAYLGIFFIDYNGGLSAMQELAITTNFQIRENMTASLYQGHLSGTDITSGTIHKLSVTESYEYNDRFSYGWKALMVYNHGYFLFGEDNKLISHVGGVASCSYKVNETFSIGAEVRKHLAFSDQFDSASSFGVSCEFNF